MAKLASEVVKQAQKWIGKNEKDGSHKEIIDIYNAHKPLARGYKVKYTDEWCATFVSAVAIKLGYTDIIPTECSCTKMIELLKKIDSWVEDESVTPSPGWICLYDWQDNGKGDNRGSADHVGIVEYVQDGKIVVIEGNYNEAVKRRTLDIDGKYIRGYGAPKYDSEASTSTDETNVCKVNLPILRKGDKNASVRALQILLIGNGFSCGSWGADGDFGNSTLTAVKAYQEKKGLVINGIVEIETWKSLLGIK